MAGAQTPPKRHRIGRRLCDVAGGRVTLSYILRRRERRTGRHLKWMTSGARSRCHDCLARLVAEFDRETTPYRAVRRARFKYDYDAYAHLARVAEWSVDTAEEE